MVVARFILTICVLLSTAKTSVGSILQNILEFSKAFYSLFKNGIDGKHIHNYESTLPITSQYLEEDFLKDYSSLWWVDR